MPAPLTIRRSALAAVAVLLATVLGRSVAMAALGSPTPDPAAPDGVSLAAGLLGGALLGSVVLAAFVWPAPGSSLALERPTGAAVLAWTVAALGLVVLSRAAFSLAGQPPFEPEWMSVYRTAPAALLAVALTVTSLFEELYFRGLLQGTLARTRLGETGALLLTAVLFAAAHAPAHPLRALDVLATSLLLGFGRVRTGSSLTMMPAHVLGNLAVLATLAYAS